MNTHSRSLGVFVPGTATAQLYLQNPFSAQQGMGDFVPASFPVPQNPIADGNGGLGQFMDACFPVPQNPIADAANIIPASAAHGTGMGCASCGGTCGSGMGDVATFVSNISAGDWQACSRETTCGAASQTLSLCLAALGLSQASLEICLERAARLKKLLSI